MAGLRCNAGAPDRRRRLTTPTTHTSILLQRCGGCAEGHASASAHHGGDAGVLHACQRALLGGKPRGLDRAQARHQSCRAAGGHPADAAPVQLHAQIGRPGRRRGCAWRAWDHAQPSSDLRAHNQCVDPRAYRPTGLHHNTHPPTAAPKLDQPAWLMLLCLHDDDLIFRR